MHCVLPFRTKAAFHDPQHTAVAAGVGAAGASAARESRAGWSGRECGGKSAKARLRERERERRRRAKAEAELTVLMLIDVSLTPIYFTQIDRQTLLFEKIYATGSSSVCRYSSRLDC